ncbi:MAG: type II secretion system F family protein [Verrucomicrobia bacterium]|nr:type II secretion system F family protein [Verrucomicrobiota bacterium]
MATFTYEALAAGGVRTRGTIEAKTRQEALANLGRLKLQPLRLQQEGVAGSVSAAGSGGVTAVEQPMTENQIISFTEELGDLLDAGLQLEGALKMMEQRSEVSTLKTVAQSLRQQVREGTSLSRALRSASASFSDLYCNLVSAGEVSGALGPILQRQVLYLKKLSDLKARVIQALIYPMFVTGAGILLMVLFVVVLVPQLETLFSKSPETMPLVTKLLLATSHFLVHWGWLVVVMIVLGSIGFWQWIQKPLGRIWWDQARMRIPVAGAVLESSFYAQFSQTLANLLTNGVTLLQAMQLVTQATPNSYYRIKLEKASGQISEGYSLSRALRQDGGFSDMFLDLVAVGEQTGELAKALDKAGARFEKDMDRKIQRITALIQPVIIVIIALVVGMVVYSIITSIFDAMSGMRKSL